MKKIIIIGGHDRDIPSVNDKRFVEELIEFDKKMREGRIQKIDEQMRPPMSCCGAMPFEPIHCEFDHAPVHHQMPPVKKNPQTEAVKVKLDRQTGSVNAKPDGDVAEFVPADAMMALARLSLTPDHIIKSGDYTHVFWKDGSRTTVKRHSDDVDDPAMAFGAAIVKKLYGTSSKVEKLLSGMTTKQRSGKEKADAKILARTRKEVSDRLFAEETYADAIREALEYLGFEEDEIPFFAILNKDSEFGRRVSNKLNGLDLAGVERIKEILDEHEIEVEITEEPADPAEDAGETAHEQEANADADKAEG